MMKKYETLEIELVKNVDVVATSGEVETEKIVFSSEYDPENFFNT